MALFPYVPQCPVPRPSNSLQGPGQAEYLIPRSMCYPFSLPQTHAQTFTNMTARSRLVSTFINMRVGVQYHDLQMVCVFYISCIRPICRTFFSCQLGHQSGRPLD